MLTIKTQLAAFALAPMLLAVTGVAAHAQYSGTVTLQTPVSSGAFEGDTQVDGTPGGTVQFNGNFNNQGPSLDDATVSILFVNPGNDPNGNVNFFSETPVTGVSLPTGDSGNINLGSFSIDPNAANGNYEFYFEATQGENVVDSQDFSVKVAPTPEASSVASMGLLCAAGMGAVVLGRRKRQSRVSA